MVRNSGVLLCTFVIRAVEHYFTESHNCRHTQKHLLEIGKDKDIFYIPGDIDDDDDFDNM